MQLNEYQQKAMTTLNQNLSNKDILINSVMGLSGESGETIDIIKKHLYHNHPLDTDHLIKELGDILWYLAEAAAALNTTLEHIATTNIIKLQNRYPQGFSEQNSINRSESDI